MKYLSRGECVYSGYLEGQSSLQPELSAES